MTGNAGMTSRKLRHIDACLTGPVEYVGVTTGFERVELPYNALTQTSLADVDLGTMFLGVPLTAPVIIGAMTGGAELARTINRNLAGAAQKLGIGMMLGSQRIMLGDDQPARTAAASFEVRDLAPDVLLIGNIGLAQMSDDLAPGWRPLSRGWVQMPLQCIPIRCRKRCRKPATPISAAPWRRWAGWPRS